MITYSFFWDPTPVMPTPGQTTGLQDPQYNLLYIVKLKDAFIAQTNGNWAYNGSQAASNLDMTSNHFLLADGSIDPSALQEHVHYSVGVNESNVILNDQYFDVQAKWNFSYNPKSVNSLNLPGNAQCSWQFKLPGGHRRLDRIQDWQGPATGNRKLNIAGIGAIDVANPILDNLQGNTAGNKQLNKGTGVNNNSWLRFEPKHVDWKDQYHILGFTTMNNATADTGICGTLSCRMDYTFSTK